VMRFRQIQFTRAETNKFEPPTGYIECADMQILMGGPVVKFMKESGTTMRPASNPQNASPIKPAPTPSKKQ